MGLARDKDRDSPIIFGMVGGKLRPNHDQGGYKRTTKECVEGHVLMAK